MPLRSFKIRAAEPDDVDAIFKLTREFATSFTPNEEAFRTSFMALLTDANSLLAVAEVEEVIVGYVLAFSHFTLYANGRVAWVEEIMVHTGCRKQGIGKMLMQRVEDWAAGQNCRLIALATRRAAEFYEALGYQPSATYYRKLM